MKICISCKKPLILSGGKCVYCGSGSSDAIKKQEKAESKTQIQQVVKPISQKKQTIAIQVTSPCYDNIGRILDSLNIDYSPFDGTFNCNLLFINCGTKDSIDTFRLIDFVSNGNVVYISDQASWIVQEAFPGYFDFEGNIGEISTVNAHVADSEIKEFIGNRVNVFFDMPGWSKLKSISSGEVILYKSPVARQNEPLMVMVPYGRGKIFYTCFHNHAQASDLEEKLLRLLILKQISVYKSQSIKKTTEEFGIDLQKLK